MARPDDPLAKGWPADGARRVSELRLPALVLRESAVAHNVAAMAGWCARHGVLLAPHGKTTMAPALFRRQLAAGAWGITVADVRQAAVALDAGARRIMIANELADAQDCAWVARTQVQRPGVRILFCVDGAAGVALAADGAAAGAPDGPPLDVLVELGYPGGRCGARDVEAALAVARAVAAQPRLRLAGVEGYEGLIAARAGRSALEGVDAFLSELATTARAVAPLVETPKPVLSAGGSAWFDRVVALLGPTAEALGWRLVLRSGCYVTHDHGLYARLAPAGAPPPADGADGAIATCAEAHAGADGGAAACPRDPGAPRFQPALELHARVLSTPEPGRAIAGFGRRDASYDADLPVVLRVLASDCRPVPAADAIRVVALNDQHAHLELAPGGGALRVGDTLVCGISHPCTTFERWRAIALADDDGRVLEAIETRF